MSSKPTVRTIARLAGISSTAVSMALRSHPKISAATRARVRQIAEKLNYRPDPEVSKLMHHLRSRRKANFQSTLCAITTIPKESKSAYVSEMIQRAQQRADSLGYSLSVMHIDDEDVTRSDLQRVLRSRGIEGLLLLPVRTPREFDRLLDWREFSVVSTSYSMLSPHFHRVVPHQFSNMMTLCRRLKELRYQRLGFVLRVEHDVRVHHSFSAAVAWQNTFGGTEFVQPLIYSGDQPADLTGWFERERPDVIVPAGIEDEGTLPKRLGLRVPGAVGFASTSVDTSQVARFAGIQERPGEIGARAIELLASMVQRGEKGIPEAPTVTMVEGLWVEGASIKKPARDRVAASKKK
jgi:DNA-binding LacI/PurR family transcriptional regulator